ncbi:MAG: threonine synthase, partial [Raoultibacter sp.]
VEAAVPFTEAVINGLADGGGLFVPEQIPQLALDDILALAKLPYAQRAAAIYKAFSIDLPEEVIDELMTDAYGGNFDTAEICP